VRKSRHDAFMEPRNVDDMVVLITMRSVHPWYLIRTHPTKVPSLPMHNTNSHSS